MTISVEIHGAIASVILSGSIDYSTQEEFKRANKQVLSADGVTEVHVNFAKVDFLDSSGIRALVILQKEADALGKLLVLLNCNNPIRELFDIGGFDKMFTFR